MLLNGMQQMLSNCQPTHIKLVTIYSHLLNKRLLFLKAVSFSSCFLSKYHPITKPMGTNIFTQCSLASAMRFTMIPNKTERPLKHYKAANN